jgi:hypothetical protein
MLVRGRALPVAMGGMTGWLFRRIFLIMMGSGRGLAMNVTFLFNMCPSLSIV